MSIYLQPFLIKILGLAATLLCSLIIGNLLGAEALGIISIVGSMFALINLFSSFGTNTLLIKVAASLSSQQKYNAIYSYLGKSLLIKSVLTGFAVLATFIMFRHTKWFEPGNIFIVVLLAASVIASGFESHFNSVLKGIKKASLAVFIGQSLFPILLLATLYILIQQAPLALNQVAFAYAGLGTIVLILSIISVLKFLPLRRPIPPATTYREVFSSAYPYLLSSTSLLLIQQTDLLMLGHFLGASIAGGYSVAMKIALLNNIFLVVTNVIIAPKIAEHFSNGKLNELFQTCNQTVTILLSCAIPCSLMVIFFSEALMGLWGDEFRAYAFHLIVLTAGQFINLSTGPVGNVLGMTQYAKTQGFLNLSAVVVNLTLNWILIQRYGAIGAAYATSFSVILLNLSCWLAVKWHFGRFIVPEFKLTSFKDNTH